VSRSLLGLTLFFIVFDRTAAQAGATVPSLPPTPPGLITARSLCEQGRRLEAIDLLDRILERPLGKEDAAAVDAALERCLQLVEGADDSEAQLMAITWREGKPSGLKALSRLADREVVWQEGCAAAGPFYRELIGLHAETREAARVMIVRAGRCLEAPGYESGALRDLETVATLQAGQPEGAKALYELGNHYSFRERRNRAAGYYKSLIDSYPESLEYPHHPGIKIVRSARAKLNLLHLYTFSPTLDRLAAWLRREVLQRILHVERYEASTLAILLLPFLVSLGALALALAVAIVVRRRDAQSLAPDGSLFDRTWSLRKAYVLLAGCCALILLVELVSDQSFILMRLMDFNGGTSLLIALTVFSTVLRREPLGRIFALNGRRLVHVLLWSAGAFLGAFVVTGMLLFGLERTGIIDSLPPLDRFGSIEAVWPSEWWSLGFFLVILSAVTEEVLFRGALHEALRRVVPVPVAAVLGSFVFAMWHMRPFVYTVVAFVMGMTLVFVRERYRSLGPGSIVHSLWNLLMFWLR
jgi:membrane protease YdiL (CAAX protease family)